MEFVDSHALPHSQPATEGGANGVWPIPASNQPQESRSMPCPEPRSAPARYTTGDFTIPGASRRR
jgi:hypothetical protein